MKTLAILLATIATPLLAQTSDHLGPYIITIFVDAIQYELKEVESLEKCVKSVIRLSRDAVTIADGNVSFGCEPVHKPINY